MASVVNLEIYYPAFYMCSESPFLSHRHPHIQTNKQKCGYNISTELCSIVEGRESVD
jgi:hypothetical protein